MKWEDASGRMEEALVKQIVMALPKKIKKTEKVSGGGDIWNGRCRTGVS